MNLGNVLVTGGAGFIGCALSNQLAMHAERWVVLDSLHPQVHENQVRPTALHESAELIIGDVVDEKIWENIFDDFAPDLVIHLAAETGTAQSMYESSRHALVNVVGTTRLMDALGKAQIFPQQVILTSSRAIYGEGRWQTSEGIAEYPGIRSKQQLESGQWDFSELSPVPSAAQETWPHPTSVYGSTKLDQEHLLSSWGAANNVPITILRLQNVYGPGQSLSNPYTGIVSLFSQLARNGKSIPLYEDGNIVRDFVLIDDVVSALVAASQLQQKEAVLTCDVGSGVPTTISQVATWLSDFYDAKPPHVTGQFREGDVRYAACNIDPTIQLLGWKPQHNLEEGLLKLQQWLQDELSAKGL